MKIEIKTIIFDFGDVLVTDTMHALERSCGYGALSAPKKRAYIKAIYSSEVGAMTTREMLKVVRQTLAPHMSLSEIETYFISGKVLPTWKLAETLAQRYQVLILSNNQKQFPKKTGQRLGINFLKFPFVNSANVGMRKPHRDIYVYVLKRFRLRPAETVFIDDKAANLVVPAKLGIRTFQYKNNYRELVSFLKKQGIKI